MSCSGLSSQVTLLVPSVACQKNNRSDNIVLFYIHVSYLFREQSGVQMGRFNEQNRARTNRNKHISRHLSVDLFLVHFGYFPDNSSHVAYYSKQHFNEIYSQIND